MAPLLSKWECFTCLQEKSAREQPITLFSCGGAQNEPICRNCWEHVSPLRRPPLRLGFQMPVRGERAKYENPYHS